MTRVVLELDPQRLGVGLGPEDIPVLLYGSSTTVPGAGVIGNDLRDRFERLGVSPSRQAMDLVAVAMALQFTRIGKAMRAVADNRDLAASSGIDVEKVIRWVWIAGSALAALGGVLFATTEAVGWEMGFRILLLMFAGVTLGGLGTAYGALFGGLVVGVFIQTSTLVIPSDMKNVGALLMLVIVLLVRPQGLFGRAERIG